MLTKRLLFSLMWWKWGNHSANIPYVCIGWWYSGHSKHGVLLLVCKSLIQVHTNQLNLNQIQLYDWVLIVVLLYFWPYTSPHQCHGSTKGTPHSRRENLGCSQILSKILWEVCYVFVFLGSSTHQTYSQELQLNQQETHNKMPKCNKWQKTPLYIPCCVLSISMVCHSVNLSVAPISQSCQSVSSILSRWYVASIHTHMLFTLIMLIVQVDQETRMNSASPKLDAHGEYPSNCSWGS